MPLLFFKQNKVTVHLNDSSNMFSGLVERTARDLGNHQDIVKKVSLYGQIYHVVSFGFANAYIWSKAVIIACHWWVNN